MDKKSRFIKVIKENEGLIFKVANLYTNSLHDQEDLYQEIVFQLWKSFDSFNELSKLSTWMYQVAMNTAIYTLKTAKRKIETISIDDFIEWFENKPKEENQDIITFEGKEYKFIKSTWGNCCINCDLRELDNCTLSPRISRSENRRDRNDGYFKLIKHGS